MSVKVLNMLKTMVISYLITGIMLIILSFGLYKMGLSEFQVSAGIIVTYALSAFAGGYIIAKKEKTRRLMWGIGFGILYFVVLFAISLLIGNDIDNSSAIRSVIICVCAGAIGAFGTPVPQTWS